MRILYKMLLKHTVMLHSLWPIPGVLQEINLPLQRLSDRSPDQRFLHILCLKSKHHDKVKNPFSYFRYLLNFSIKATYKFYLNILASSG